MHVVAVVVAPGTPLFELSVPIEVFGMNRIDLVEPWYDVRLCGLHPGRVEIDRGFSVDVKHGLEGLETADTVIVPSAVNVHGDPPAQLGAAIRAAHARGARIASICSGAFVLAAAGILDDRRATTHWIYADELARRYPAVRVDASVLYRQDGQVLTSAGTAAGLDLCLELVRQDHGSAVANRLARRLVIPPHRAGGQAQYVETPLPETDDRFSELLDWALARLDRPLTLLDLRSCRACEHENARPTFPCRPRDEPAAMASGRTDPPRSGVARDDRRDDRAGLRACRVRPSFEPT